MDLSICDYEEHSEVLFCVLRPRSLRGMQNALQLNFKRWGIKHVHYARGWLVAIDLREYVERGVSEDLQEAMKDRLEEKLQPARQQAFAKSRQRDLALLKNCFAALAAKAEPQLRALKMEAEKAERRALAVAKLATVVQKAVDRQSGPAVHQLARNAAAYRAAERKIRAEKATKLYAEFVALSGVHAAINWPADLSGVESVYDIPDLASYLPRRPTAERSRSPHTNEHC